MWLGFRKFLSLIEQKRKNISKNQFILVVEKKIENIFKILKGCELLILYLIYTWFILEVKHEIEIVILVIQWLEL